MANDTIDVNLTSTGNPYPNDYSVEFPTNSGSIDVGPGDTDTINWVLQTAPSGATITAVAIDPGQPGNVPWGGELPTAANSWTTTDTNNLTSADPPVSWSYTVTVTYNGYGYTHDPEIVNDPPTSIRYKSS